MKKLLVLVLVLSIATIANAGLVLTGIPTAPLTQSDFVTLGVFSDGQSMASGGGTLIHVSGPGVIDITGAINTVVPPGYTTGEDTTIKIADWDPSMGDVWMDLMQVIVPQIPIPSGQAISNLIFHCEGVGPVTITLYADDGYGNMTTLDTQVITQIPEPITMTLLGLGGLFLRRRK